VFRGTAHIYDLIYAAIGKDYASESATIDEQIRSRHPSAQTLLDVACGTGGHLRHLREKYDVTGLDLDPGMLEQARASVPGVPLVEADMRSFDLGRAFDAVVCLFSSIGYGRSVEELNAAINCMAAHLAPNGVLLVDGWIRPDAWIEPGTVHAVAARDEDVAVARVGRSRREGRTTVLELHHLVATLDSVEHIIDHHELTRFEPIDYEGAFRAAGLDVERVDSPIPDRDRYIGTRPRST
jgi:SAM-dependent methyltransferase